MLCTPDGELLGALPTFEVPTQWWRQVDDVVTGARQAQAVDVRVLSCSPARARITRVGGPVSYLAEVDRAPDLPLTTWPDDPLAERPLRPPYARPGGHTADLTWAKEVLCAHGHSITSAPQQIRTWNLRVLLGEVPGEDQCDATRTSLLEMVRALVRQQVGGSTGPLNCSRSVCRTCVGRR